MPKKVLITGGSRGIGFSIAKAVLPYAERLILVARHEEQLGQAVEKLDGSKITAISADLTDTSELEEVVNKIKSQFNALDVLVNNAGIYIGKRFEVTSLKEINQMIDLNFKAYTLLISQLLPLLKKGDHPQIINISSCAARAEVYGESVYSATKAAVTAFSNVLRKELNERGIRVTAIQPWGVDTYGVEGAENFMLNPDEVGKLAAFIISASPTTQIDWVELSHIKQWRGEKPPWVE